eukprot:TRINITY_DN1007_c0_g1_i1.p2 TRINITY_DN1007_c0_g1~~TRINITY_DN1007_c0_g1_i1.p2  ORF type:complete len:129 (-),score=24.14 TRINITY_DN1007_c0_g1_i1:82-468(-)
MANLAKTLVSRAQGLLKWLKAPWQITGPLSTNEYKEAMWDAADFRLHAPATPTVRASVPHADPERVLDIKYHTRDRRRQVFERKREELDPNGVPEGLQADGPPARMVEYFVMGKDAHVNDVPGDGYQK